MTSLDGSILRAHRSCLAAVVDAGVDVAAGLTEPVTDPEAVRGPLDRQLRERGLHRELLAVLDTAADAAGGTIQGQPVAAPPYLTVTSRGPVCRATLADGRRLVVTCALFAVERRPRRYTFRDPSPAECLEVSLRRD